eukprot:gene9584-9661_t
MKNGGPHVTQVLKTPDSATPISGAAHVKPKAVFTQGSTMRHVVVMTLTGTVGLMAIFLVDLLSLIYVSHLGDTFLTAAVGYASTVMFFAMSINIGMVIATTAVTARALGAGDREGARRLAASSLTHTAIIALVMTAFTDPLFIFGFGFGVYGAAIAIVISRFVFFGVGFYGAIGVHKLVKTPDSTAVWLDIRHVSIIAVPAILTNLATPVGNSYAMRIFSHFGEEAIAAFAVIDRITPVAFGVIFALTGSLGPVISQNLGARLMPRVRQTLNDAFLLTIGYVACVWVLLWLGSSLIVKLFGLSGETAALLVFYCNFGASVWMFLGALFVANTAFNNLGFPIYSTVFNWGRATLGTIPFVTFFASYWGVKGGMLGMVAGTAIFGTLSVLVAYVAIVKNREPNMFSLNDILASAQNSQNMGQLAQQFSISPQQTQAAVQSLLPAFAIGLQQQAAAPQNIATLLASMMAPSPPPAPAAPPAPPALLDPFAYGNAVMAQLFGSSQATGQIAQAAAQQSGLQPQIVQQMMPWVAGMVMNGLAQAMQGQGAGGFMAGFMPQVRPADPATAAAQSGFEALQKMMQGGVQMQQAQLEGLQAILSQLSPKR